MSGRLGEWRAQQGRQQPTNGAPSTSDPAYELSPLGSNGNGVSPAETADLREFDEISQQIQTYRSIAQQISVLHSRSLEHTDDTAIQQDNAQLAQLTADAADVQAQIRRRIQAFHVRARTGSIPLATIQHANRVQERFKAAIQDFQQSERDFRAKYAARVGRQFRIVKPDATPEEIRAVVEDPQGGTQIFKNAVAQSERYAVARQAYKEVQDRHAEIQRLEASIEQLGQLFNDMAILIDEQDETINHVEKQAEDTHRDLERGGENVEQATEHARAARRKRWWCFFICLLIIAVIVIAVAVPIALKNS